MIDDLLARLRRAAPDLVWALDEAGEYLVGVAGEVEVEVDCTVPGEVDLTVYLGEAQVAEAWCHPPQAGQAPAYAEVLVALLLRDVAEQARDTLTALRGGRPVPDLVGPGGQGQAH